MDQAHSQTAGSFDDHQVALGVKVKEENLKEEQMDVHVDVEAPGSTSMEVGGEEKPINVGSKNEEGKTEFKTESPVAPSRPPVAVESLLSRPFSQRSPVEKMDVLARGRPTPDIDLTSHLDDQILRFDSKHYITKPWLSGCPKANKLFCWPCLLFSAERSIWNTGFEDLKNLQRDALEHERTVQHISSQVQLCTYGHARHRRLEPGSKRARLTMDELYNVKPDSDTESESSVPKEQLTKDQFQNPEELRYFVLKMLSHVVMILGSSCQDSLVDDEEEDDDDFAWPTPCFQALVRVIEYPFTLMSHTRDRVLSSLTDHHQKKLVESALPCLNTSSLLSSLTIRHQNNLVESVGEVLLEEIKREIKGSSFVSLILHETSIHSLSDPQLAMIMRYVTKDRFAVERFVGYTPEKIDTAEGLTELVFTFLEKMDCGDKMVALSHAGQAVSSSHISGHLAQVKEQYPWVNSVHWYISETGAALANACGMTECFFASLHTLGEFFTASYHSPDRVRVLEEIISKRGFPSSAPLRWTKKSDLVKTVKEHRESLIELSHKLEEWPDDWDRDIMDCSWMFEDLEDPQFLFLLEVFSAIFCCTDKFVNALQRMILKTGSGAKALKRTLEALKVMHGDFDAIFSQGVKQVDNPTRTGKWEESSRDAFRELYARVLDAATSELAMRFESLVKITFTELLNVPRFQVYRGSFPEDAFNCLKDSYGRFFDLPLLRNELEVVYSSPELKKKNFHELVTVLHFTGLNAILPQVSKLCDLIQILPLGSVKKQRGFSAISRRMQIYANQVTLCGSLDGRRTKGRVPALALMAIERKMFRQISKSKGFSERVVHLFDQKEPRINLVSK